MAFLDIHGNGEPMGHVNVERKDNRYIITVTSKEMNPIPFLIKSTTNINEVYAICGRFFKQGYDVDFDYLSEEDVAESLFGEN